jgi:hypothetical protein
MTYAELTALLQDTVENSFTAEQLALFFQAAEEKIYNVVQPPAIRRNQTGTLTASNQYLTTPSDFLYPFSLAVDVEGEYQYLLDKDVNYIREAYPSAAATGVPRYYAVFDENTFILGPTPDTSYTVELHYARYPTSITTGTSWLGTNYPTALLNMAVVEAGKFLKLEQDTMAVYDKQATESLALVKNAGDGKMRQDTYRSGQVRITVK